MNGYTEGEWQDELEDLRQQVAFGDVTPETAERILELEAKEAEDEDAHLQEILGSDEVLDIGWTLSFAGEARSTFLECLNLLDQHGPIVVNVNGDDRLYLGTATDDDGIVLIVAEHDEETGITTGVTHAIPLFDLEHIHIY